MALPPNETVTVALLKRKSVLRVWQNKVQMMILSLNDGWNDDDDGNFDDNDDKNHKKYANFRIPPQKLPI